MNHFALMSVVQRRGDGGEQTHYLVRRRKFSLVRSCLEIVDEGGPFHIIHDEVGFVPVLGHVEILDRDDIGMA
jgi:hypothetical protein